MSRKHTNAVISEAVHWFYRFQMKSPTALSPTESEEWALWSANKIHLAQFRRVEELWNKLQALSTAARPTQQDLDGDTYDPEHPVSEWLDKRNAKKSNR